MNTFTWAKVTWFCFGALLIVCPGATPCPQDYVDTGQSQAFLAVGATAGGTQVDLQGGVLRYCVNPNTAMCMITCTVKFTTVISPSYFINEHCYSAGEDGEDLQEIVVNATSSHPNYTILFHCDAISTYRCVFNDNLYTQEVKVQPDTSACSIPDPPTTSTSPPVTSDGGNTTNDTNTIVPPPHMVPPGFASGAIAAVIFGPAFGIMAVIAIMAVILVVYRDRLCSQGSTVSRMIHSCFAKCRKCGDGIDRAISAECSDNGKAELVLQPVNQVEKPQQDIAIQRKA